MTKQTNDSNKKQLLGSSLTIPEQLAMNQRSGVVGQGAGLLFTPHDAGRLIGGILKASQ